MIKVEYIVGDKTKNYDEIKTLKSIGADEKYNHLNCIYHEQITDRSVSKKNKLKIFLNKLNVEVNNLLLSFNIVKFYK